MNIDQAARTMFARHKLGGGEDAVRWLKENNYVAINWDDSPSTDENKYGSDGRSRAYQEVRRIGKVSGETRPVIVGAYYGNKVSDFREQLVIGRVDPEADVHIIHHRRGDTPIAYDSEKAARNAGIPDVHKDDSPDELEDQWIYKALPLVGCAAYDEPKEISLTDYPLLSAVRPRHHSFCDWHTAEGHLKAFDVGYSSFRNIEDELNDPSAPLAPSQLEVVCNEYLRQTDKYNGYTQLLPVGRTLRDVDVIGSTEEERIFAQVTKASGDDLKSKAKKLASYKKPNVHTILFGPDGADEGIDMTRGVDEYISVTSVVKEIDSQSPELLDMMYKLPDPL